MERVWSPASAPVLDDRDRAVEVWLHIEAISRVARLMAGVPAPDVPVEVQQELWALAEHERRARQERTATPPGRPGPTRPWARRGRGRRRGARR